MTSLYGATVSLARVEAAVLSLLTTPPTGSTQPFLIYYLAEIERQEGLQPRAIPVPPGPNSYRGGVDAEVFQQEWAPQVTVIAQPIEDPERYEAGRYSQAFAVDVVSTVAGADEDTARVLANRYGAAVMKLIVSNGGLGTRTDDTGATVPFAQKTVLTGFPRVEFVSPTLRRVLRSIVGFHVWVEGVVTEQGPLTFGSDPYTAPTGYPQVAKISVALQAKDPLGNVSPADGVTVTSSSGHVIVTE